MSEFLQTAVTVYALLVTLALLRLSGGRRRRRKADDSKGAGKTSNTILLMLGGFLLIFITAMTVIFCVKGAVPDTLIQYTLGAGGVEALLLAGIKISKVVTGDKPGERTDTNED